MFDRRILSQFDYLLLGLAVCLALVGVVGVYSAGAGVGNTVYLRQLLWVVLGASVCVLSVIIDYRVLTDYAFLIYTLLIAVLIGLLLFGTEVNGSRSWLGIAGVGIQPSELGKLAVILAITRYLSDVNDDPLSRRHLIVPAFLTLVPMVLIYLQGDLGTATVYAPIALGILLVAGLRLRLLVGVLAVLLCLAPIGWYSLNNYQQERILTTVDPNRDPQGFGYQTRQAQIAIGSGGLTGQGVGQGRQSRLGFVPEIQTDFIFALLAEELGFLGGAAILFLYLVLLLRLISIGEKSRDRSGILIVAGIASFLTYHVVVNVGMTLGLVPTIGIPLPLVSYGGSATLTTFLALGLAINIYYRRFVY